MKKRILALILSAMMCAASFTACSNESSSQEGSTNAPVEENVQKDVSLDEIVTAVKEAYGDNYGAGQALDAQMISDLMGINMDDVEESFAEIPMMSAHIDTFIVLTLNALVIISTLYTKGGPLYECGAAAASTVLTKTNLAQTAFGMVFGEKFGAIFVAICLFFFAFSTVLSWNLFGKINANYLFGKKNPKRCTIIYTVIALVFVLVGTMVSNNLVWELTDAFNYLMVLPNAIALFALTGMVVKSTPGAKK